MGKTHGYSHGGLLKPEYDVWSAMKSRCQNVNHQAFARYGARGIKVCKRWQKFELFIEDMGPRPHSSYTLDRIDNSGDYNKENCRWTSYTNQNRNRGKYNHLLQYQGATMTISEASQKCGVSVQTIRNRINKKWPQEIIFTPVRKRRSNGA
jgi:hypothetical protein